ncbi:hypothetical protein LCGC14_1963570 [marine sediment metagenome]|uniref:Uncharacterized protein n=1 Tax=marine sediment metagenome TaxID=412755 RepID=A0A0F9G274_9ZZZZ
MGNSCRIYSKRIKNPLGKTFYSGHDLAELWEWHIDHIIPKCIQFHKTRRSRFQKMLGLEKPTADVGK